MKLKHTRKAVAAVRAKNLHKDFVDLITRIEKSRADVKVIGRRISALIDFTLGLRHSLPARTRFAIADGIFADAAAGDVPHQWERKVGFECGKDFQCSKPNPDKTCYRDTSGDSCISG